MARSDIYTIGGTVQAGGGIYLTRHADHELLELCRDSKFAYILTSRQMGKSSLMVRTAEQLSEEGVQSVIIDLTQVGVQVTAEEWYLGLLTIIEDQVMLDTDITQWWQAHQHLGITQRLTRFFQQVLLPEVNTPIVIFVDEIDTTLGLDFADDFFAAIRYLYLARAREPKFKRLSFVLIGVATPSDLIRDPKRTPFNIGQQVELTDFSVEEALPLTRGFELSSEEARQVLNWVLKWTNGHPYLTQRLCQALVPRERKNISGADVDQTVNDIFLGKQSQQDSNLQFVRDMLTKRAPNLVDTLKTYRQILCGKRSLVDEEQSLIKSHLKLSGVVCRKDNTLQIRNLIYKKVFDRGWIKDNLPNTRPDLRLTFASSVAITVIVIGLRFLGLLQTFELQTYDLLLRLRPKEEPDERLLIVSIDDKDIEFQRRQGMQMQGTSLSDEALVQLLEKLEQYHPRVIGLDLSRDFYAREELANHMRSNNHLLVPCSFSDLRDVPLPPEFPLSRLGFSDVVIDPDRTIRRHLLAVPRSGIPTESHCPTPAAFSMRIGIFYLSKEGVQAVSGKLQIGETIFKPLEAYYGGYQGIDADGYQILLNYRASNFPQVSLSDVLDNGILPTRLAQLLKDRIVLVGFTNQLDSHSDSHSSPFNEAMPGVVIHAHMVSQIISTVLDKRPLLWAWPLHVEVIWIWSWSLIGGLLAWYFQSPLHFGLAGAVALVTLSSLCWGFLSLWGGWVPFIPAILAMTLTGLTVVTFSIISKQKIEAKAANSLLPKTLS
ncbi:MAG: CHASE2 domain-containing protein [Leptolyngbyaceae cyanobacterium MO_188.B28]|nr:CHASE2 domain-containing protein [Leptolyngbyaceae cyanobacterium MO_188.B28]